MGNKPVKAVKLVNSLEEEIMSAEEVSGFDKDTQSVFLHMRAYKIVSLALHF
jgi:hypothetical protein